MKKYNLIISREILKKSFLKNLLHSLVVTFLEKLMTLFGLT